MASESVAFFEGKYMPLKDARISILDPVVTKSDVVFDVVSATDRTFFRLGDHVERFEASCAKVRIKPPVSTDEIKRISAECVHRSGFDDACVFMCGTRGLYRGGAALGDPRECENGFYAYAVPYYYVVPKERIKTGAHIWIVETRRAPNAAIDQLQIWGERTGAEVVSGKQGGDAAGLAFEALELLEVRPHLRLHVGGECL